MVSWGLVDTDGRVLPPFVYTNGKTQEDVVEEIILKLRDSDIVFLRGGVGTGKSPIALHLIGYYGKGIISTPTKLLERQYTEDYCGSSGKKIIVSPGEYIDINFLMGRWNFRCPRSKGRLRCSHRSLVCVKRLPKDYSRCSVAMVCPFWSPVYRPGRCAILLKRPGEVIEYESVKGERVFYRAEHPCPYYDQFIHFTKPGAIIMNSAKWEVETLLGRKPKVPIEIIDEGDEYLDGLNFSVSIAKNDFNRIRRERLVELNYLNEMEASFEDLIDEYGYDGYDGYLCDADRITGYLFEFLNMLSHAEASEYILNKESRVKLILEHEDVSWAKTFRGTTNDRLTLFIPTPEITLKRLLENSGKVVFMSATVHKNNTLRQIFKIDNPVVVQGEEKFPGILYIMEPSEKGALSTITYRNWNSSLELREDYWGLLDRVIEIAAKPCLVQVHAFRYLPEKYMPSKEQREEDYWYFGNENVIFSTKTDRGIDLRDDRCRSIVLMKYPMPNISDIILKTMRRLLGETAFWNYMHDMANRNMIQQCGRALRHKDDWCQVYSLDAKVLRQLPYFWQGEYVIKRFNVWRE